MIFSSFFFALDFDSLNVVLKEYSPNYEWDFETIIKDHEISIKESLNEELSQYYHPDKFLIDVDIEQTRIDFHDSTVVSVEQDCPEPGSISISWIDENLNPSENSDFHDCTYRSWYIIGDGPHFVATVKFQPVVIFNFEKGSIKTPESFLLESIKQVLKSSLGDTGRQVDIDLCDEYIYFEEVNNLKDLKASLIEQELKELAVIEYDVDKGFVVYDNDYEQYKSLVQKTKDLGITVMDLMFKELIDDGVVIKTSVKNVKYIKCSTCDFTDIEAQKDTLVDIDAVGIPLEYKKDYKTLGLVPLWGVDEFSAPLMGIAKLYLNVFVDKSKFKGSEGTTKSFVKDMLHGWVDGLENCDECITFEFVDDMVALKTEMMNKELKDKTVIEYSKDSGFTFYDNAYIDYEDALMLELESLSGRGAEIINGLLDDVFFVEASVMNTKYFSDSRFQEIAQLEAENKTEEANKIRKQGKAEMKKWETLGYSRPSFSGPFWMFSKLFLKVYVDENNLRVKELLKVSKRPWERRVKALIYSQYKDLESCDDCVVFELADFNDLKANQLAKKNQINRSDVYDNSWAVIIGINDYPSAPPLNYAVKDAQNIQRMLIDSFDFPEENIEFLINEQATFSGIRSALNDIKNKAEENDRVIVFYSGHGQTVAAQDGTNLGYLIPYEGTLEDPYGTGMSMSFVQQMGLVSEAKHMLFLMDACYSGLMAETSKGGLKLDKNEDGYLAAISNEDSRQIITAGRKDQEVIERDEWENSAFTKNLLSGLNDWRADIDQDGYITAEELGLYLKKTVTEDSNQQQTPLNSRFQKSGDGEFIFFKN